MEGWVPWLDRVFVEAACLPVTRSSGNDLASVWIAGQGRAVRSQAPRPPNGARVLPARPAPSTRGSSPHPKASRVVAERPVLGNAAAPEWMWDGSGAAGYGASQRSDAIYGGASDGGWPCTQPSNVAWPRIIWALRRTFDPKRAMARRGMRLLGRRRETEAGQPSGRASMRVSSIVTRCSGVQTARALFAAARRSFDGPSGSVASDV